MLLSLLLRPRSGKGRGRRYVEITRSLARGKNSVLVSLIDRCFFLVTWQIVHLQNILKQGNI